MCEGCMVPLLTFIRLYRRAGNPATDDENVKYSFCCLGHHCSLVPLMCSCRNNVKDLFHIKFERGVKSFVVRTGQNPSVRALVAVFLYINSTAPVSCIAYRWYNVFLAHIEALSSP